MEVFGDEEGVEVIIDDILVHGKTMEEHDARLARVMKIIQDVGLRLNKEKCKFRKQEVAYFGHVVGHDGLKPHPEKTEAISKLPEPKNIQELRTVLGMFNYLSKFLPNLSSVMKPMSSLLKADAHWAWGPSQQQALKKAKQLVSEAATLTYFDPQKATTVSADASSYGLGAVLLQEDAGKLKPVAYCSRTMTPAEQRYAQIEKECLAGVWACEKFSQYLTGLPSFTLQTDHKPLVPLLSSKSLDLAPLRCQRLLIRMMRFNPVPVYVPGKQLQVADALSRSPQRKANCEESQFEEEIQAYVEAIHAAWPASPKRQCEISLATENDKVLSRVQQYIANGWPLYKSSVSPEIQPYFEARGHLSMVDGIVTYGDRIVIPESLQEEMLNRLHESHQGLSKCLENASSTIWWPGMTTQLRAKIEACLKCRERRPMQRKEPLKPSALPDRPWQVIATDLFEMNNKHYIVAVDKYSRWIEIKQLHSTTTRAVVNRLKEMFVAHGIPEVVQSDNGPQYTSDEYQKFAQAYGFTITTSSPHFHQANGAAESAVKVAKGILSQVDPCLALLNYRNTPHSATGVSPASALMGRRLRSKIPVLQKLLLPQQPSPEAIRCSDEKAKKAYKESYDRHHGARPLPNLQEGQPVLIRTEKKDKWMKPGVIVESDHEGRTYMVHSPTGMLRRNRIHLQPVPHHPQWPVQHDDLLDERQATRPAVPAEPATAAPPMVSQVPTQSPAAIPPAVPLPRRSTRAVVRPTRLIEEY